MNGQKTLLSNMGMESFWSTLLHFVLTMISPLDKKRKGMNPPWKILREIQEHNPKAIQAL